MKKQTHWWDIVYGIRLGCTMLGVLFVVLADSQAVFVASIATLYCTAIMTLWSVLLSHDRRAPLKIGGTLVWLILISLQTWLRPSIITGNIIAIVLWETLPAIGIGSFLPWLFKLLQNWEKEDQGTECPS